MPCLLRDSENEEYSFEIGQLECDLCHKRCSRWILNRRFLDIFPFYVKVIQLYFFGSVGSRHLVASRKVGCFLRLRANGRNNSLHCCANNVGSCWVRVGSGVQTDATTPNNVGTCSASWEGYNP